MTFSGYHLERMGCTTSFFSCTSSNLTLFKLQVLQAELWEKGQSAQTKLQTARDAQAKLQNATCETTHVHKTFCGKNVVHKTSCTKPFWIQRPGVTTSLNPPIMLCVNPPKPFLEACRLPVCPPRPSIWYVDKWESADVGPQGVEMHVYFPIGRLGQIYKPKSDCICRLSSLGKATRQITLYLSIIQLGQNHKPNLRLYLSIARLGPKATSQTPKTRDCTIGRPAPRAGPQTHVIAPLASQPRQRTTMLQAADELSRNLPNGLMPHGV